MDDKYKDLYDEDNSRKEEMFNILERLKLTPKQAARCVTRSYEKTKEGLDVEASRFLHIFTDLYETNLKAACLSARTISANEVIRLALQTGYSNDMGQFPNKACKLAVRKFFKRLGKAMVWQARRNEERRNGF
jgi:hypothetical protein